MSTDTKPPLPHQRFEVSLRISAHSWEEAVRTAQELADHIHEHGPHCSLVGGGRIVHIVEDPEMTREKYEADLHAYVEATRKTRTQTITQAFDGANLAAMSRLPTSKDSP